MIEQVIQTVSEFAPNDNVRALAAVAGAASTVGLAGYGLMRRVLRRKRRLSERALKVLHLIDSLPVSKWDVADDVFTNGNISITAWRANRNGASVVSPQFGRLVGRDATAVVTKLDQVIVAADQARLADSMTVDKMKTAADALAEAREIWPDFGVGWMSDIRASGEPIQALTDPKLGQPHEEAPAQTYQTPIRRIFEIGQPQSASPTEQILASSPVEPVEIEGQVQVGLTPEQTNADALNVRIKLDSNTGKYGIVIVPVHDKPGEEKAVEAPTTLPAYWKDEARRICGLPPSDAAAEFNKLDPADVGEVGNIVKKEYGQSVYDFLMSEREKASFVSVPVDPETTVAEDIISGLKDFAEKLEAGEPVEATTVVKQGMASEEIQALREKVAWLEENMAATKDWGNRAFTDYEARLRLKDAELKVLYEKVSIAEQEREEFRVLAEALKANEDDYKQSLTEYDQELDKVRALLTAERHKTSELDEKIKQLQQEVARRKESEEKLIILLGKRGTELDTANAALKKSQDEYETELEKVRGLLTAERHKVSDLSAAIVNKDVEIAKLNDTLTFVRKNLFDKSQEAERRYEEVLKYASEAGNLRVELKELETKLATVTAELEDQKLSTVNWVKEAQVRKEAVHTAAVRIKELVVEYDTLSEEKRAAVDARVIANKNYEALCEEFKKLDLRCRDEVTLRKQLASECESLKAALTDRTSERDAAQGQVTHWLNEANSARAAAIEISKELDELKVNKPSVTHNAQQLCLTATGKTDIKVPSILRMDDLTFEGKFMGESVIVERKDASFFLLPKQQTV